MRRLAEANSKKMVRIYNPDTDDFTVEFHQKPYTIYALEMAEFPYEVAKHIKKHLADKILFKRGIGREAVPDLLAGIYKEIEVEI